MENLKRRWKNLQDSFTRYLKKIKDKQRSGSGNIKILTCRFFKELEFLKDRMRNKPATSNVNIVNNSGSALDDISSLLHTPVPSTSSTPDTNLGHLSNKPKLTRLNQIDSRENVSKHPVTLDKTDLLLVNVLSKENEASAKKEFPKSGNELFCASLVEVFACLTRKRNQMARIEII